MCDARLELQPPDTQYARRADGVHIAYQVVGDGPLDLLFAPGFASHLDFFWTDPGFVRFIERLAEFSRVVLFDKPGTGLSDPISHVPTLEERVQDIEVILDGAGAERPILLGFSESGPACVVFAARRPERVHSLVLVGSFARVLLRDGPELTGEAPLPAGFDAARVLDVWDRLDDVVANWGRGKLVTLMAPSIDTPLNRRLWARFERASASPSMLRGLLEILREIDVREVARAVDTPALVIHLKDDPVPIAAARELADQLPNCRMVELPGDDHVFWGGDPDPVVDEIRSFVTGTRDRPAPDRVLTTVLFTDIVDSTPRAATLGDRGWRDLLEHHNDLVERAVGAADGRVVKFMGDGVLAVLPGPVAAVQAADEILRRSSERLGLQLRAGVHTGECEPLGDDVAGLAVHIGARVVAAAGPGEILVSGAARELVGGGGLAFEPRGTHALRGVPGTWQLHAVVRGGTPQRYPVEERRLRLFDRAAAVAVRRAPTVLRAVARRGRPVPLSR